MDALGSVIALTDETGAIKTQYTYDPFGNVTVSGESSDNPFQYTGRENDGTGLYYYRARYYSPELQRFISEDPLLGLYKSPCKEITEFSSSFTWMIPFLINYPEKLHKYSYVNNRPLILIDPLGLISIYVMNCPPPPAGYTFVGATPIPIPIKVCIPNSSTGKLECDIIDTTCAEANCKYKKTEKCKEKILTLKGTCYTTNQENI